MPVYYYTPDTAVYVCACVCVGVSLCSWRSPQIKNSGITCQ